MLRRRNAWLKILSACLVFAVVGSALRSLAYVDLAPTLAKIITDAKTIALVEVVEFDRENCAIVLKEVRTLKGEASADTIRHLVASSTHGTVPLQIAQWVEPGARGVLFMSRSTTLVCVGHGWYQVRRAGTGPWKLGADRPDLPLSYYGSVSRMTDGIERMLSGKDAILTAVAYGSDDVETSIDLALNRTDLPGLVRVARINANLRMPPMVMAASGNAAYLLGEGPVALTDVPDLLRKLRSPDSVERAEAAEDLGWLGSGARAAVEPLRSLLDDAAPRVRFSAAAALLRIAPSEAAQQRRVGNRFDRFRSGGAAKCGSSGRHGGPRGRRSHQITCLSAQRQRSIRAHRRDASDCHARPGGGRSRARFSSFARRARSHDRRRGCLGADRTGSAPDAGFAGKNVVVGSVGRPLGGRASDVANRRPGIRDPRSRSCWRRFPRRRPSKPTT